MKTPIRKIKTLAARTVSGLSLLATLCSCGGDAGRAPDWLVGDDPALTVREDAVRSEVSWFAKAFAGGARQEDIAAFFTDYGYDVTAVELVKIEKNISGKIFTYAVFTVTAQDFYRAGAAPLSDDTELTQPLVAAAELERGLPPGAVWDIANKTRAHGAGRNVALLWKLRANRRGKTVADHPQADGTVSDSRLAAARDRYAAYRQALAASLDVINREVNNFLRQRLATVPGFDAGKFDGISNRELTRSGLRVGGGDLFGAAAGSFGGYREARMGAAAGTIAGFAYDWLSKENDKKRREKEAAAHNAARRAQLTAIEKETRQLFRALLDKYQTQIADARTRPDDPLPVAHFTSADLAPAPKPTPASLAEKK
ncbi:MAG: hypothetical protein LBK60_04185 [Verrucomicrobiales bacterium]|jgi:hypothetical protein|nr:hypothetical protein [Verrucomicrobiales bacterium]